MATDDFYHVYSITTSNGKGGDGWSSGPSSLDQPLAGGEVGSVFTDQVSKDKTTWLYDTLKFFIQTF